ncbi:hypothetical protein [Lactobacillus gasseri]|uniref:hypothetical protein n=1 Tax=Lactobacillus gasseri TaxID=1596 RepID=UPI00054F8595|nr:hypothetical protein [Lactobacillus gasseri]
MTKLKRYLVNLKLNDLQVIIAITMIAIGGSLWYDRHYFFWPPNLQSALNDWRIDYFYFASWHGAYFLLLHLDLTIPY